MSGRYVHYFETHPYAESIPEDEPEYVYIPLMDCCDSLPWDCCCRWSCVGCRTEQSGQGECGDCNGGYE